MNGKKYILVCYRKVNGKNTEMCASDISDIQCASDISDIRCASDINLIINIMLPKVYLP